MVVENYRAIEERVKAACERAGRKPSEVTLIAVSKTKPDEMVEELAAIGVRDFGENKPQELARKHDGILPEAGLHWHMIGNIQTNKVKLIVGNAVLVHSVPDLHIAQALSKQAEKLGVQVPILIEVNIGGEETKQGFIAQDEGQLYGEVERLVIEVNELPGIKIMGLMAIAPPVENPEDNRGYFRSLRQMRDKLAALKLSNAPMTELSMGMTGDFEVAIEEGATYVRVGTAIFGERNYGQG